MFNSKQMSELSTSFKLKKLIPVSAAGILGGVFLLSSTAKIFFWSDTTLAIEKLLSTSNFAFPILAALVVFELFLGLFVLLPGYWRISGLISFLVMVVFTAVVVWGKQKGLITECPCFGKLFGASTIGSFLYARNAILAISGLILASHGSFQAPNASQKVTWLERSAAVSSTKVFLFILFVIGTVSIGILVKQNSHIESLIQHQKSPAVGSEAFLFKKRDVNGKMINTKGKTSILFFLSSDCSVCIENLPEYQDFYRKYTSSSVTIAAVTIDPTNLIEKAAKKLGIMMPMVTDNNREIFWEYKVRWVPLVVLVNEAGKFKFYQDYYQSSTAILKDIEAYLEQRCQAFVK